MDIILALKEKGLAEIVEWRDFLNYRAVKAWYAAALKDCLRQSQLWEAPCLGFCIITAFRKALSVDYYNRYETFYPGLGKIEVHALTFTYRVEPTLPQFTRSELSKVFGGSYEKNYQGKMQVFIDPSDGQWKQLESKLPF